MHPTRRRVVGAIALAIPFSTVLIRGAPRTEIMSAWVMLGTAALVAVVSYFLWPIIESLFQERAPAALTWTRFASLAGIGVLLAIAIVVGGNLLGRQLDPWLVLGVVMLFAMLAFVGGGREAAAHLPPRQYPGA